MYPLTGEFSIEKCAIKCKMTTRLSMSLSENSVVGPRASHFFVWQRRRSRRCWFYRRYSRMQPGRKRAARSQIEFSDRLLSSAMCMLEQGCGDLLSKIKIIHSPRTVSSDLCQRSSTVEFWFRKPVLRSQAYLDKHQHKRNLDQHADNSSQRRAGAQAEEHSRRRYCNLKVIGSAYHRRRSGVAVLQFH